MNERTFNLAIATFPYGGNGGMSNEYPGVRNFLIEVSRKAKADPRIGEIHHCDFSDTPITMTRNRAVLWARQVGADFLLMIDSDMQPDCELRDDPDAKPFWDTSLDFVIQHYDQGPNVVCAPYCGPPPFSNVYVFYWALSENDCPNDKGRIEQYSREEASRMVGIQPCAAQPTGLILFDMRAFNLTDPEKYYRKLRQTKSRDEARALVHPWFYYEYEDIYQSDKASTEDVTATRDISFHGWLEYGRETIYCNWDAWAGHVKPKVVRKPRPLDMGSMHAQYRHAVEMKQSSETKMVFVGAGDDSPGVPTEVRHFEEQPITHILAEEAAEDDIVRIGMHTPKQDLEALSDIVATYAPKRAMEIGSWVGESAIAIAKHLPKDGLLICVDHFLGSPTDRTGAISVEHGKDAIKDAFRQNTVPYYKKIVLWEMTDSKALTTFQDYNYKPLDFLYLDADHEYEFVKRQIENWTPLMSPEGIIAGHDFYEGFPGVMRAVKESFTEYTVIPGTVVWFAHVKNRKAKPESNGKPSPELSAMSPGFHNQRQSSDRASMS